MLETQKQELVEAIDEVEAIIKSAASENTTAVSTLVEQLTGGAGETVLNPEEQGEQQDASAPEEQGEQHDASAPKEQGSLGCMYFE